MIGHSGLVASRRRCTSSSGISMQVPRPRSTWRALSLTKTRDQTISPGFEVQGKLRVLRQTSLGAASPDLSAYGYEAVAGLAAEISPLLRWRLLGGYGVRDYDSAQLKTAGNALMEGEIQWLPTQLMTLTATARRENTPERLVVEADVSDTAGAPVLTLRAVLRLVALAEGQGA